MTPDERQDTEREYLREYQEGMACLATLTRKSRTLRIIICSPSRSTLPEGNRSVAASRIYSPNSERSRT